MSTGSREHTLYTVLLAILAVAVIVLSVLYIEAERQRNRLALQSEVEMLAGFLLASPGAGPVPEAAQDPRVLGYGLYDSSGEPMVRSGSAPAQLKDGLRRGRGNRLINDWQRRTITLIRRVGGPAPTAMMRQPMMSMHRGGAATLYLEVRMPDQWAMQRRFSTALVVVPLLIAMMAAVVGYLYFKNTQYRRQMAAQAQLARLGEVARTLAHEIKNPLGVIRVQTGFLKKTLPPERTRDVELIEEEVSRLALLSDRIGTFLRDPRGRPEQVELTPFASDLVRRFDGRVSLEDHLANGGTVSFDRDRLRSVLENLIRNALESDDSGDPQTSVVLARRKDRLEIQVLDRGAGVDPDLRDKIFDPFYTSKTTGSGVGLAIARRFVEAAGGRLTLEPREGGGTRAVVSLEPT